MWIGRWLRPPRQVLTTFLVMAVVSAAVLAGLTWQILRQDRDLEGKRQVDRLQQIADRAAAGMQQALADLQAAIGRSTSTSGTSDDLPRGVLALSLSANAVTVRPPGRLLYGPSPASLAEAPSAAFAEGERLEFAQHDLPGAERVYTRLAQSSNADVRAGALMRLARTYRRLGADERAREVYDTLFSVGSATAGGLPAPLVARVGRMAVFKATSRPSDLAAESQALLADLEQGRWPLSKGAYEAYSSEARAAALVAPPPDQDAVAHAEAVGWLWSNRDGLGRGIGRRVVPTSAGPAVVMWAERRSVLDAIIAGPTYVETLCAGLAAAGTGWAISDAENHIILGIAPPPRTVVYAPIAGIDLPWTLGVYTPRGHAMPSSPQRPLLLLVLVLVLAVLSAGWYAIFRSLARERRVAQLQADFVAAVSHEFRSPLTSIAHVAELLEGDRLPSEALRHESYGVLTRDTARLRTLVEGLLDFGRFEAGRSALRVEPVNLGELVSTTVEDFRRHVASSGYRVELTGGFDETPVRADREALARALWNLLDNAVKYSPDCRTIWVDVRRETDRACLRVRDRGLGIPRQEQTTIFDRFVRGAESKTRRIRGTGIGLAMVRQIARAHGGDVAVESAVGAGSTFTFVLPAAQGGPEDSAGAEASEPAATLREIERERAADGSRGAVGPQPH